MGSYKIQIYCFLFLWEDTKRKFFASLTQKEANSKKTASEKSEAVCALIVGSKTSGKLVHRGGTALRC